MIHDGFYMHIHVSSAVVPYCNLKKTGIELGAEECRSIHKALAVIMRRISKLARSSRPLTDAGGNIAADHFPYNKFQSKLDYEVCGCQLAVHYEELTLRVLHLFCTVHTTCLYSLY